MKIGLLKPEQAAKHAREKVAAFKTEQAKKAVDAKNKEKLNALLVEAVAKLNWSEIERLVKAGADVDARDARGNTAMMMVAWHDHREIIEMLIAHKADVNAKNNTGETALMIAAIYGGFMEIVQLLIDAGADVNARDNDGGTVLRYVAQNGPRDVAELLRAHGATE